MCGRFTLFAPAEVLAGAFGVRADAFPAASWNIAPSRSVAVVRAKARGEGRDAALLRWGLVPSWSKDPSAGNRMINARAETAFGKPAFRAAMRARRCLVPADGFYEWKRLDGRKQPYFARMADGAPFAFAGIWERWEGGGEAIESCALLTTEPNALLAPVHDRMPVIVDPADYDLWIDPAVRDPSRLSGILVPFPAGRMAAWPVRPLVNNPAFDDPRCVEPVPA